MVSVIIPMYNAQDSIIRCLESVVKQTYEGIVEIIVVNDGSTDNSPNMVREFIQQHPMVIIQLLDQQNGGVSKARNRGLKIAQGDFIALLDADDEWYKNKLEIQMPFLLDEAQKIDFIACNRNNEKITFPYRVINNKYAVITLRKLLFKIIGQTSTAVFKKKILENTGYFDENQKYSEDANYWLRISLNNNMIILTDNLVLTGGGKPSVGFSGLSSNIKEMEAGVQKNILEMYKYNYINILEYAFFLFFSKVKYIKRMLILKCK